MFEILFLVYLLNFFQVFKKFFNYSFNFVTFSIFHFSFFCGVKTAKGLKV